MTDDDELLQTLTGTLGLSGHEDRVIQVMVELLRPHAKSIYVDPLGNVLTKVGNSNSGETRKLMIFAHADELGFVVKRIESNGFIRLERLGGVPEKSIAGQSVMTQTQAGVFQGLIGTKAHHLTAQEEKHRVKPIQEVYADFGFRSKDEALRAGIDVGTPIGYQRQYMRAGDMVFANALDNRAGCWTLVRLAERLSNLDTPWEVWLVISIQEEFSIRGVLPAARAIQPGVAVAVDIAIACDTPDLDGVSDVALGEGPALATYSFHGRGTLGGLIPNPKLVEYTSRIASDQQIPLQKYVLLGGLTDSSFLQLEGRGIPSIDIGFPLRYSHAPVEAADFTDLHRLVALLEAFVAGFSHPPNLERGQC